MALWPLTPRSSNGVDKVLNSSIPLSAVGISPLRAVAFHVQNLHCDIFIFGPSDVD